jgi:hypothetical protein
MFLLVSIHRRSLRERVDDRSNEERKDTANHKAAAADMEIDSHGGLRRARHSALRFAYLATCHVDLPAQQKLVPDY